MANFNDPITIGSSDEELEVQSSAKQFDKVVEHLEKDNSNSSGSQSVESNRLNGVSFSISDRTRIPIPAVHTVSVNSGNGLLSLSTRTVNDEVVNSVRQQQVYFIGSRQDMRRAEERPETRQSEICNDIGRVLDS